MTATIQFHRFNDFADLSDALLSQWISMIDHAVLMHLPAYFALAGGSTPAPLYRKFDDILASRSNTNVRFVATDERWVPDTDPQSNEGLFKQCLPQSYQAQWGLVSLKNTANTPEVAVEAIDERLRQQLPQAFNAVLLGMGTDGHIASLFPQAPTTHDGFDCIATLHPQTQQTRMSLSLPRLINTEKIWLVITGDEKKRVLDNALHTSLPISALLHEAQCDIEVFWCP
jgi:6-phosphogluconolactonase